MMKGNHFDIGKVVVYELDISLMRTQWGKHLTPPEYRIGLHIPLEVKSVFPLKKFLFILHLDFPRNLWIS